MDQVFEMLAGGILGLVLIAGVFWFAFGRMPERRSDTGLTQHDAVNYFSGDEGGGHFP
jgi:nitrate reductase gamma subunit